LRAALQSACAQSVPLEIIVMDDASDDGTAEMVRAEFPQAILITQNHRTGYIVLRNRGARRATAPIVFSMDDDAIFTTSRVVEQVLREFAHPRVGAVAIPYADIRIAPTTFQRAPDARGIHVTDMFIGTAHAVRRDLFFAAGGYRELLIHQGEEMDLCARFLQRGYVVRLGTSDPVHHFVSPKRDMRRLHYFGTRNSVVFACMLVPLRNLPVHLAGVIVNNVRHAMRVRALGIKLRALFAGFFVGARAWRQRAAVSPATYRQLRRLRHAPQRLESIEPLLAPLPAAVPAVEPAMLSGCG
jgi:glycosyltransferase involved in cell wall biosynthesis